MTKFSAPCSRRAGFEVGVLEQAQHAVAEVLRVERGVEREGVLVGAGDPEEVRFRADRQHEVVAGELSAVVGGDGRASTGSMRDDLAELHVRRSCALRNSPRSGRMTSPGASWAVATWYSNGWNW